MLKIAVVANCQARPIAFLFENALDGVEVVTVAIVHLLKDEQACEYESYFKNADFIVTQKIADNYPCQFIRTSELRKQYSQKIIEIPNLFYSGYNPELRYYRIPGKGTLNGPLGDYHNELLFEAWSQGRSVADTKDIASDEGIWVEKYSHIPEQSLLELSKREFELDVEITDFLSLNISKERLFYTFNHPSLKVLAELVKRIAVLISRRLKASFNIKAVDEPLNQFYIPINPHAASIIGFDLNKNTVSNCRGLKKNEQGKYTIRGFYSTTELIEEFFISYDENKDLISANILQ